MRTYQQCVQGRGGAGSPNVAWRLRSFRASLAFLVYPGISRMVPGSGAPTVYGSAAVGATTRGAGLVTASDGDSWEYDQPPGLQQRVTNDFTIGCFVRERGGGAWASLFGVNYHDTTWTSPYGLGLYRSGTGSKLQLRVPIAGAENKANTANGYWSAGDDAWHFHCVTRRGGTVRFYKDGELNTVRSTDIPSGAIDYGTGSKLVVCGSQPSYEAFAMVGDVLFMCLASRAATAAEVRAMWLDPYLLARPQAPSVARRVVWSVQMARLRFAQKEHRTWAAPGETRISVVS